MPTIITKHPHQNKKQQPQPSYNHIERISNYKIQRFAIAQGYTVSPSQQQLFYHDGKCQHLVISNQFGEVKWEGDVDLSRLAAPLSQTVIIKHREIEVYVGNQGTPARGKELNRPCLATFRSAQSINIDNLVQICNKNGTKMIRADGQGKIFTIAIPHFTRYNFNETPLTKKQAEERRRLTETMIVGRRNRIMQQKRKMSEQMSNKIPFPSARLEELYNLEENREYVGRQRSIGSMMDGLKSYVVNLSSKFVEKQGLLYDLDLTQNVKALAVENQNRAEYNFLSYEHTNHHTSILQNVLFSADGEVCQLKNYQKYQKLIIMSQNKPEAPLQFGLQSYLLLGEDLTAENVGRVVCESNYAFSVKRLLSLYAILFANELCFVFRQGSKYRPQLSIKYIVSKQLRKNAIKDWLAWVIRQQFEQQLTNQTAKNKVMSALALRKPELAIDYLIVNNRWAEAMLISRLEDSKFRQLPMQKIQAMHEEFQIAMGNRTSMLGFQQWLLCFGFSAWYFRGDTIQYFSQIINSARIKEGRDIKLGLQLRLFQLYVLNQNFKVESELFQPEKPTRQQLYGLWFISHLFGLQDLQKRYWLEHDRHGQTISLNYSYQLQKRITQLFNQNDQRIPLLLSTKKSQTDSLLIKANKRIKSENQLVLLVQQLISEGKMIEALRVCLNNETDITEEIQEKVYFLVCHPSILLSYKTQIREEVVKLLIKRHNQFEELILLLTFQKNPQTGIDQLKMILRLYRGESRFRRILSPQVRSLIKSKLQMCIGNWIYEQNPTLQTLQQNPALFTQLQTLLQKSELFLDNDS